MKLILLKSHPNNSVFFVLFLAFTVLLAPRIAQAQASPNIDYETVVNYFFDNYQHQKIEFTATLGFEKRKAGFFISEFNEPDFEHPIESQLLWSTRKGAFEPLTPFSSGNIIKKDKTDSRNESLREYFLGGNDTFYFDHLPYYGYPGWTTDVIKLLEDRSQLNDQDLFALAYSYDEHANNLIRKHIRFMDSSVQFDLPPTKNAMTPSQLAAFRKNIHKAQEYYLALAKQNPDFPTIVGPIFIKYSGEVMDGFLSISYYQNEAEALKELNEKPPLFNPFLLEGAQNLLRSCPENAVLFTWGDNDTYPLLYLQATRQFRKDVTVVNLSLLGAPRYTNHLRDANLGSLPLNFQLSREFYMTDASSYALVAKNISLSFKRWAALVDQMTNSGEALPSPTEMLLHPTGKGLKPISWTTENVLSRNEIATLDLIASNFTDRPICYSGMVSVNYFSAFDSQFIQQEGMIFRLLPNAAETKLSKVFRLHFDFERSLDLINNSFSYESTDPINASGAPYRSRLQILFIETVEALIKKERKEEALELLDRFASYLPNERDPYTPYDINLFVLYKDCGRIEMVESSLETILNNLKEKKIDPQSYNQSLLGYLVSIAESVNREDLIQEFNHFIN